MTKNKILLGFFIVLVVSLAAIAAIWLFILKDTEEASGPLASIPIATPDTETSSDAVAGSVRITFQIIQAESEARFTLNEVLSGRPTTVVGVTDQVAGEIAVDPGDPASAQIGIIRINARTLATDNDLRNRAIRNRSLQTMLLSLSPSCPR